MAWARELQWSRRSCACLISACATSCIPCQADSRAVRKSPGENGVLGNFTDRLGAGDWVCLGLFFGSTPKKLVNSKVGLWAKAVKKTDLPHCGQQHICAKIGRASCRER